MESCNALCVGFGNDAVHVQHKDKNKHELGKGGKKVSLPAHKRKTAGRHHDTLFNFLHRHGHNQLVHHRVNFQYLLTHHAHNSLIRASRGLGLEFVRQLTDNPHNIVIASCRNPDTADALQALRAGRSDRLFVVILDVSKQESIVDAALEAGALLGERGLDVLFNNAAIVS